MKLSTEWNGTMRTWSCISTGKGPVLFPPAPSILEKGVSWNSHPTLLSLRAESSGGCFHLQATLGVAKDCKAQVSHLPGIQATAPAHLFFLPRSQFECSLVLETTLPSRPTVGTP